MSVKNKKNILGMHVNVTSPDKILKTVKHWISDSATAGKNICVSNVHMCMESFDDPTFCKLVNDADLVIPDGKPLVWAQKLLGEKRTQQVRGADITALLCEESTRSGIPIAFYGGTDQVLHDLELVLKAEYPGINIVCKIAPPFRALTPKEDLQYIQEINDSGAEILFVGIGCPKQERWMAEHKASLSCVMLGVGAVFDFMSGNKPEAPEWLRKMGLEWFFRLVCEPKRLWHRYLTQNPRFIFHFAKQYAVYRSEQKELRANT